MGNTIPVQATFEGRNELPGAAAVLALGILSLVFVGLIGLIFAIITVSKAKECTYTYELNPDTYRLSSYKNMRAGRVCGIISMSILATIVFILILVVIIGNM